MVLELPHLLGVILALLAAACFAVQFLCVRVGTVDGGVIEAVFVSLLTNVVLVGALVLVWYGVPAISGSAVIWFALAGISGSLIARTCMFKSVQILGASRTSPVISANVFFAAVLALVLFDESVTAMHALGIVTIVVGVAVISWETAHEADPDQSWREVGLTIALPLFAAAFIAFEPVFVTLGLREGGTVLPGVAVKVTAAWLGFAAYMGVAGRLTRETVARTRETGWYVAAGLTSAVGIVAYFAALEAAPIVIVVPLIQTAPLIVVLLSWVLLPTHLERVTWRLIAAAVVVVAGASIVGIQ